MTVKELQELLQTMNPNAQVYTISISDDVAVKVLNILPNVLEGTDETVVLVY